MKKLTPPEIMLFHWHTTLVDTSETLYHALDDVLPQYGRSRGGFHETLRLFAPFDRRPES